MWNVLLSIIKIAFYIRSVLYILQLLFSVYRNRIQVALFYFRINGNNNLWNLSYNLYIHIRRRFNKGNFQYITVLIITIYMSDDTHSSLVKSNLSEMNTSTE